MIDAALNTVLIQQPCGVEVEEDGSIVLPSELEAARVLFDDVVAGSVSLEC